MVYLSVPTSFTCLLAKSYFGSFKILMLFIVCSNFSALSIAEDDSKSYQHYKLPHKIQIVRGEGDYPPLEMVVNGHLTGVHIEMIRYVAKQLNVDVEFLSLPWARAINYFSEGHSNAISYFGFTEERQGFSYYHSENILSDTRWVLIALEGRKDEFQFDRNLVGLGDVVIGVQNQYSHGTHFDSMKQLQKDVVINEFDLERMLKNKRHDLAMISYQEFMGFKERGDFEGIIALSPAIDTDPQYLAFSSFKDVDGMNKELAKKFALEFRTFKKSKEYRALLEQFNFYYYQ